MSRTPVALVTGSGGFVGGHVVRHLARSGWHVVRLRRGEGEADDLVYDGSFANLRAGFERVRPDVVFHIGSLILVDHEGESAADLVDANVRFPALLLEAMAATGCARLVNTGTSWQHHDGSAGYRPTNLYAATKQAFVDIARLYADARGFRIMTLYLFDTYGPGDGRRKLLPHLVRCALQGEAVELTPGLQEINLVHVQDVAEAFRVAGDWALSAEAGSVADFAVRAPEACTVRELVDRLGSALGRTIETRWGARPYRAREVMRAWNGPVLPGWRPRIGLVEGLAGLRASGNGDD